MKMTVDYSKAGNGFVEAGEYEVVAGPYSVEKARSGNMMIQFNYQIREDVDQKCQGLEIKFDNFVWTQNSLWRLQSACKAAVVPEGVDINSPDDFGVALNGKSLRVVVEMEEQENGKSYPRVKRFKESEASAPTEKTFVNSEPPSNDDPFAGGKTIDINDDDLPF